MSLLQENKKSKIAISTKDWEEKLKSVKLPKLVLNK